MASSLLGHSEGDRVLEHWVFVSAGSVRTRAGWGVVDQALSSIGNAMLGVVVAQSVSPSAFGAFALSSGWCLVVLSGGRALTTTPLMVDLEFGQIPSSPRTILWISFWLGILLGVVPAGVGLLLAWPAVSIAPLAVLPAVLIQDSVRNLELLRKHPRGAALNDAIFSTVAILGMLASTKADSLDGGSAVLAWGCGAGVAGVLGWRSYPGRFGTREAWQFLSTYKGLAANLLVESVALSLTGQLTYIAVGSIGDLRMVGLMRAAFGNLLGPANILIQGLSAPLLVEFGSLRGQRRATLRIALLAGLLITSSVAGLGLLAFLMPNAWGQFLAGPSFSGALRFVPSASVSIAATGIVGILLSALRTSAPPSQLRNVRLIVSLANVAGASAALGIAGERGLLTAMMVIPLVSTLMVGLWCRTKLGSNASPDVQRVLDADPDTRRHESEVRP